VKLENYKGKKAVQNEIEEHHAFSDGQQQS